MAHLSETIHGHSNKIKSSHEIIDKNLHSVNLAPFTSKTVVTLVKTKQKRQIVPRQ